MKDAKEDSYNIYKTIGTYILLVINGILLFNILYLLYPYIDYGLRNNSIYIFLRNKVPYIKKHHEIF